MAEVTQRIHDVLIQQFGVEYSDLGNDQKLRDDVGMDDIDLIDITMALEDAFDVEITDEDAEAWSTVGDIITCISAKIGD